MNYRILKQEIMDVPLQFERVISLVLTLVGLLIAFDLYQDFGAGASTSHVLLELAAFGLCALLITYLLSTFWKAKLAKQNALSQRVTSLEQDRNKWRDEAQSYLKGLGVAIEKQFAAWGCSASETEIGFLILKGLSHKEIALIRNTSEQTVRQQAASLYGKSGVSGKNELFAFFLEDLMPPTVGANS